MDQEIFCSEEDMFVFVIIYGFMFVSLIPVNALICKHVLIPRMS